MANRMLELLIAGSEWLFWRSSTNPPTPCLHPCTEAGSAREGVRLWNPSTIPQSSSRRSRSGSPRGSATAARSRTSREVGVKDEAPKAREKQGLQLLLASSDDERASFTPRQAPRSREALAAHRSRRRSRILRHSWSSARARDLPVSGFRRHVADSAQPGVALASVRLLGCMWRCGGVADDRHIEDVRPGTWARLGSTQDRRVEGFDDEETASRSPGRGQVGRIASLTHRSTPGSPFSL
jgi:hypothetical protein